MSRRFPLHSPSDLTRACEKLQLEFRKGKERNGLYFYQGQKLFRITIAKKHKKWGRKLERSMMEATRLSPEDFDKLVKCNITGPGYEKMVPQLFPDKLKRG